ncbi:MAG: DUF2191 domain-containing protein [Cyclobacteriaceae bacterium]
MKITALIDDKLIDQVKEISGGKNITESLVIALKDYVRRNQLNDIISEIENEPMIFQDGFTPYGLRQINRSR